MKKNIYLSVILYINIIGGIFSQTIDFNWAVGAGNASGGYGSVCLSMTKDNSGNLYCLYEYSGTNVDFDPGSGTAFLTSNGDRDMAIASYTPSGALIWVKGLGGNDRELPRDIFWSNNSLYVAGSFSTTVDFDPNAGVQNKTSSDMWDIFMLKLTDAGDFLWVNTFGSNGHDEGWQIKSDNAGNVIITCGISSTVDMDPGAGVSNLNGLGTYDAVVAKYDSNGNYVWAKKIGNTGYDYPYSLGIDNANNIYYGGIFQGTVDFDPGSGVQNITGSGGSDGFIASLDQNGNYRWVNPINNSYVYGIGVDNANNVIITGSFTGTQDFDGGAGTNNLTSNGSADIYLAKYTANGAFIWAFATGGSGYDYGYEISVDMATNEIYSCGVFDGTNVDFDAGPGVYNQTSNNRDMYLGCYTSAGGLKWARRPTGSSNDNAFSIIFDNATQAVYMCGGFGNAVNFNVEGGTNNLNALGNPDGHLEKYLLDSPLPVELADFSVTCNSAKLEFSWTTFSEINNSHFTIEKSSDAIEWEEMGRVNGWGNSNIIHFYTYDVPVNELKNEERYFRLKQTDLNGDFKYYPMITTQCDSYAEQELVVEIYPNPASDYVIVLFEDANIDKIEITDVKGNMIKQINDNRELMQIDLTNISSGLYIITAYSGTKIIRNKFIKY